jgi:hypothetical protein
MTSILKIALVGLLLAGTAGHAMSQSTAPATEPDAGQMQMADRGDGQGWGWWGHDRGHGKGHGEGMGEGRGRHGNAHGGGRMMRLIDANSDGAIGEDEAAALADHLYQRLDKNDDGSVDKAEFATPQRRGYGGGLRGWFGLGTDEAAAVQKVREEKFTMLDADKDGKLSKAEYFADAKARLAAADTDKDGKVSPWEFHAAN